MTKRVRSAILSAVGLALLLPTFAAAQPAVNYFTRDSILTTVLSDSMFVAVGRIGDRSGTSDFEVSLGPNMATPLETAGLGWVNGASYPLYLAFEPMSRQVTFAIGGQTVSFDSPFTAFDSIFIRTYAQPAGSYVGVFNLAINGVAVPGASVVSGPEMLRILQIYGMSFGSGFTLTGTVKLSWGESVPVGDALSFEIFTANMLVVGTEDRSWGRVKSLFR